MAYKFSNPICGGQDPFVCKGEDGYYSVVEAAGSKELCVYHSKRLTERGVKHVVYQAEESGESSVDLWAPELWNFNNKWYIYYAGSSLGGEENWHTHRMFVLEAEHPLGPYKSPVKLELGEQMAIDGSVLQLEENKFVFFYMGRNEEKMLNCLYMAMMDSPTHICGKPVLLSVPELEWESDINEGPFPIYKNGKLSLLYAANAAHLPEYCLGLLVCNDIENIIKPSSWTKLDKPLLTQKGNVIGPGHACIVSSPDDTEDWLVYHSKFDHDYTLPGGWNRVVNLLRVTWKDDVIPCFEEPYQHGEAILAPSGEEVLPEGKSIELRLDNQSARRFAEYTYSREKTVWATDRGIRIDGTIWPEFGDKLILREGVYGNCTIKVCMKNLSNEGEVGVMFGVELPAAGKCRWQGYGVYTNKAGYIQIIKCDGKKIMTLERKKILAEGERNLLIKLQGKAISVFADNEEILSTMDDADIQGQVGVGTLGGDGEFYELRIRRDDNA
ncbi:MAG: family 43 glycosylhydrolase [Tyzzerella sp.]|nr:family 43 glycosylhydrolase [Tyzzerella sp.]